MRILLIFILVLALGTLGYGFYLKTSGDSNGEIVIGIGVLIVAFILMPLFIFHQYKNKKMSDFTFEKYRKDLEEHHKKNS